jgi:hypothetical protein
MKGDCCGRVGEIDLCEVANSFWGIAGDHQGFYSDKMIVSLPHQTLDRKLIAEGNKRNGKGNHDCADAHGKSRNQDKIDLEGQRKRPLLSGHPGIIPSPAQVATR